jgi:hypothetical protein
MRRIVGFVLVGLGVALLALGVLLRLWAYPELAQVGAVYPASDAKDRQVKAGQSVSSGTGVDAFIVRGPRESAIVGPRKVDIQSERTTRGVPAAAQGDNVYWETSVRTFAGSAEVPRDVFNAVIEGVCFDRVSGAATDGCRKKPYTQPGADPSTADATYRPKGQYFKFPFNTQQKAYPFWDGVLRDAPEAKYQATETIKGLKVYRFVQDIPDREIGTQPNLAGALFRSDQPSVTATVRYANRRTLWVEPETGVIIRGQEEQKRRFVFNGVEVPALVGTIGYNDATVSANADEQSGNAPSLAALRTVFPWLLAGLGLVVALIGLWLVRPWQDRGPTRTGRADRGDAPESVDLRGTDRAAANPSSRP